MKKELFGITTIIVMLGLSGCHKKWNDFQTKILTDQAKAFSVGNKAFQKCYQDAVMSDYSGEEWIEKSSTKAMVYVSRCMK